MGFALQGDPSGNPVESDVFGNLYVTLPQTTAKNVGLAGLASVNHDGVIGASRLVRAGEVSINRRLRVGVDSLLFQDIFNYTAQNTANWAFTLATMAVAFGAGFVTLNSGSSLASGAVARISTYNFFPLINGAGLSVEFDAMLTSAPITNNVVEFHVGSSSGTSAPTDGALFRYNAGGTFQGVVNYGGAETPVTLSPVPAANVIHSFLIRIEQEETSFWVDGQLLGSIATPAGQSAPYLSPYQQVTVRTYNSGVTGTAQQVKVGEVRVFLRDLQIIRSWGEAQAGLGGMCSQGQNGQTMGSTALYTNSLAVGAGAAATNTTAALGSGLGGQFTLLPTLAVPTDGIISSFQVPAASTTVPGKSLMIRGVKISGVVTTVFTGGPVLGAWSLAYGHTAVSLATAEAATTKAPRRVPLGHMPFVVTAPVGTLGTLDIRFDEPIRVNPGEFVQTVMKNVGTVTTLGAICFLVTFDARWE